MLARLKIAAARSIIVMAIIGVTGCVTPNVIEPSTGHLTAASGQSSATNESGVGESGAEIPQPVTTSPYLPEPLPPAKQETYTVVVNQVPVRDLLFALARDADLNIDIVGAIEGLITLNAIDQTLPRILDRIALQAAIRYKIEPGYLIISADKPYLETYAIDYLNITRTATSRVDLATQIGSISTDIDGSGDGGGSNNSRTEVENSSENLFWDSLIDNIKTIVGNAAQSGAAQNTGNVIVHRESGFISVRGTQRQHEEVNGFINQVLSSARRQVLIEATVVEITLSDTYQAGIDWRVLTNSSQDNFSINQSFTGGPSAAGTVTAPNFLVSYADAVSSIGDVLATVQLLDQFGDVQILSSPKIIALNNQAAVLKVVDNRVYFTISVEPGVTNSAGTVTQAATTETEIHTVPVGFVMNVTPFISADEEVVLNVRPTISRILGFVNDPNPNLASANVVNKIPEIQVREMESLLRVKSGKVAIIGGLMQDQIAKNSSGVPGLSNVPILGKVFSSQNNDIVKTELLIFLRPTVINNASLDGDLSAFKKYLPSKPSTAQSSQAEPEDN